MPHFAPPRVPLETVDMQYKPPPPQGLRLLREELGFTNTQMAATFGVATGRQFHKYISEEDKREMGFHVLMYGMLQIELMSGPIKSVEQLYARARRCGAVIDFSAQGGEQAR
jgi:hypothetical protein